MDFVTDTIDGPDGKIALTFIGHGTLIIQYNDTTIHIDPWAALADYRALPDADLILITHEHQDHLDSEAIQAVVRKDTEIITTGICGGLLKDRFDSITTMGNGDTTNFKNIKIEAVPAYNFEKPYHPRGMGNGYILNCGKTRIYIAGDTENTEEMKALENINIAFLPMNLPYTMTPEQVADGATAFKPEILYPYHYGETDTDELVQLMKDTGIDVRIRPLS
ncbi:MBL fold metallo-hydrolase [Spirochaeta isovalerica]|uniref:L-ascorbate metabolism protein UlaG (Beta-lactamase superfamily) n=1 Tax=Spirochaeta isovalerica TaxID=150 RepID=A0A841R8S2_9SPIO|nr:MBL fold metallo-hydrolase [Spirochaeta isovalerica]MBB6479761.1 L-ascorbate metabolism protein UlaG (beta-lactamase superfamily) [Spirochaeta isovalerica]